MSPLGTWIDAQYHRAAKAMLLSISPVGLVRRRSGFGQTVRPVRGSIVASPVFGDYDPDPDYFFHWYRDSAIVMDALRLLCEAGEVGAEALVHLADFVRFSQGLRSLDGRRCAEQGEWRERVTAACQQHVRDEAELASVHGDAVAADTRVNADGSIDISRWARPQHDGPALRALTLLRWARSAAFDGALAAEVAACVQADLAFVLSHWGTPCFDLWEEEQGLHFFTLAVAAAAMAEGADWLEAAGRHTEAAAQRTAEAEVRGTLDGFWAPSAGHYRSRLRTPEPDSPKALDIAVILAALHAGARGAHSVHDPRMHATLAQLERLFDRQYPINHHRPAGTAPAMGRYAGDRYYSGGAYYFATLGAGEFCFRAAVGCEDAQAWIARGDAFLETVRAFTPEDGAMAEQFDQRTGSPNSARHLAWSYASFISCVGARRVALGS